MQSGCNEEASIAQRRAMFGYARGSSRDQNLSRQIDALLSYGIDRRHIYADKASGKDFKRPSYQRLMRRIKPGDTLVIKSVDRLGRNYNEILDEWRRLTKLNGARLVVLDMPLLDTGRDCAGVTGEFVADLMLQLLSYIAQVERENIHQRQTEGIASARARGVRFGRPRIKKPERFEACREAYLAERMTASEAAAQCGVSASTFLRWVRGA